MNNELFEKIKEWRNDKAKEEGLPVYRILQNKTIEDISEAMPDNKEELLKIKGIKDRKFEKYGEDILNLVKNRDKIDSFSELKLPDKENEEEKLFTVSKYLDLLNSKLRNNNARIQGEISSLNIGGNYLFFSLKDKDDESLLNCFMWASDYNICGIDFEEGLEIIIDGFPDIYKPQGRLSFKVSTAELVGEGALKKAYQELKKKLEKEGLFDLERKKKIPEFVQKIGLITSETGAVIHDFLNNLGKYGYQIKFFDSRVEGQAAIKDLLSAIEYFKDENIDILVIIRGGGSLESLQAFNNEILVREIANFKKPVICGIGHDKDIPLSSLAADLMVSTPTAVTVVLNKSWDEAISNVRFFEKDIIYKYQEALMDRKNKIKEFSQELKEKSEFIFKKFKDAENRLINKLIELGFALKEKKKEMDDYSQNILLNLKNKFKEIQESLNRFEQRLKSNNPENQLKLGYSIVSLGNKVIKSIRDVNKKEKINIRVSDGRIESQVEEIISNK